MNSIRILLIEDDKIDQLAFKRHVEREQLPYIFEMVKSIGEAQTQLAAKPYDIIISDYNLGDGTAIDICESAKGIPLIIITGAGNEEIAVRALKAGAFDYLIKDADRKYLHVLPLTVEKAVKSHRADAEMKMLLHAIMHISDSVCITDVNGTIQLVNKAFSELYGYGPKEVTGKPATMFTEEFSDSEFLQRRKNGQELFVSLSKSIVGDSNGVGTAIVAVARDITDRKKAEEALRARGEKY